MISIAIVLERTASHAVLAKIWQLLVNYTMRAGTLFYTNNSFTGMVAHTHAHTPSMGSRI